nr:hypothetical protein [Tanacetum cinerariifolium]
MHFLKFPENSFEVLKLLKNSVEVLKILKNKLESIKILENKLNLLKLRENQLVDELVPLSIKFTSESVLARLLKSKAETTDKDPVVSASSELFALASGPTPTSISVNSCVVNDVRFVVHSHDERRTTQNSGICSSSEDGEINKGRVKHLVIRNNVTQILANGESFKNDQYILATQVKQCFYHEDMARRPLGWKVVEHVNHKKNSNGGVIVVEDNPDIIHVDNSSDLALTTSVNDLKIMALHIDGQSLDVYALPDIIDVDKDDDIVDDEDVIPHDLANSDDEDLINVDDDDGVGVTAVTMVVMIAPSTSVSRRLPRQGHPKTHFGRQESRQDAYPQGNQEPQANLLGEIMREFLMHFDSWRIILPERKTRVLGKIERDYWVKNLNDETYDVEAIRSGRPANISVKDWDKQIRFWSNTKNMARGSDAAKDDESGDDEDADEDEKDVDS